MSPKLLNFLLVILPVVLYYGYIDPMYNGGTGLIWAPEANIQVLKSVNVQYEDAFKQINDLDREVKKINTNYENLDPAIKDKVAMMLPDSIDPVKLRNEVISIANKSNVAISGLKVTETNKTPSANLGVYTVSFSVKSHYPPLKELLAAYERSMRFFVLNNVSIDKWTKRNESTEVDDIEMLSSSVAFNVYYLRK